MTTAELEATWTSVEGVVRGYLMRRLGGDAATADDLVQEVFLRLRRGIAALRTADRLGPWVARLARSVLVDHLRRQRPGAPSATEPVAPSADADADAADLARLRRHLRAQVDALPPHEAAAIHLVDLDGVAPAAAAGRLGIGLPALKARLRRGRQHLREAIDRCCAVILDGRGHPTACEPRDRACRCS